MTTAKDGVQVTEINIDQPRPCEHLAKPAQSVGQKFISAGKSFYHGRICLKQATNLIVRQADNGIRNGAQRLQP